MPATAMRARPVRSCRLNDSDHTEFPANYNHAAARVRCDRLATKLDNGLSTIPASAAGGVAPKPVPTRTQPPQQKTGRPVTTAGVNGHL
jgi:hypothetical protein